MTPEFDVIIVGSGPAGVSAAHPLVQSGLRVLMVDGGYRPSAEAPQSPFLSARFVDTEQWKWIIGTDFHALRMREALSPKLRVPNLGYVFSNYLEADRVEGHNYETTGSLAIGGLSNAWGFGVACLSDSELELFPFPHADLKDSYTTISRRIGISGRCDDDLSDYFGLDKWAQTPIAMDKLHQYLSARYMRSRDKLTDLGFKLGRSRVAALSEDRLDRLACNLSGNCMWGCARRSLYASTDELPSLGQHGNFTHRPGYIVTSLLKSNLGWTIIGHHGEGETSLTARKIVLAAGTLASTRLALKTLGHNEPVRLLSCPTAAFLLWIPRYLGISRTSGFGLGQLSFAIRLSRSISGFGSTFSTTGLVMSDFIRHMPVARRYGIDILRNLLSSCLVGNLFLPGYLSKAQAALGADGSLVVSGGHADDVSPLMYEAARLLRNSYWRLGAAMLPGSFTLGKPGGDIHYAGTLPMRSSPTRGETNANGEVQGLKGVYAADGASLPSLTEKSHTLTIMANADRIARRIVSDYRHTS